MNTLDRRLARRGVRVGAVAAPLLIGAMLLGACGGSSDDGASQSTIALSQESTAFVVRPPVTTIAVTDTTPVAGEVSTAAQEYTVQAGDYPLKVANQFGVTVDELVAFNEWGSVDEFPFPGTVIQIPPGATVPAATTTTIARRRRRRRPRRPPRSPTPDRQLRGRRVHDRRWRLRGQGGVELRRHGRSAACRQCQHRRLQLLLPGPDHRHPGQGRLLTRH